MVQIHNRSTKTPCRTAVPLVKVLRSKPDMDNAIWECEDEMREWFPKLFELEVASRLVPLLSSAGLCFGLCIYFLPCKNSGDKISIRRVGCKIHASNLVFSCWSPH